MRYFAGRSACRDGRVYVNLEFFIARRLAREGNSGVMVRIAEVSVALGMAVMILALAVVMGFKREITRRIVGFAAPVQVADVRGFGAGGAEPVMRTAALEEMIRSQEGFAALHPYAQKEGIVKTPDAVEGMLLKGVDGAYDWSFFADFLIEGTLPRTGDSVRTKDVLLSRAAADRLLLGAGDKLEMLFVDPGMEPRRDRFRVAGIYATGMDEMDRTLMLTDLRNVQRLWGWTPAEVSGYEVAVGATYAPPTFARGLSQALLYSDLDEATNLTAVAVQDRYSHIFDWLRAHDVNAAVVIAIMLAVAFFNMASALLILVLEGMRTIGLLKTLGMRNGAVQRIFLWRGAFIVLRGVVWGNLAGVALCLVQQHFHVLKLNTEGYMLSEVPVALDWAWWLALNAGAVAVIVTLMALPARVAATVKPSETLHYE